MNIRKKLLKQSSPRLWVGAIRDTITRTQSYYIIFNMPLLLITVYTLRQDQVLRIIPWLSIEIFFGFIVCILLSIAIFDYKYVKPSLIAFQQSERWKHRSRIKKNFEQTRDRLNRIEKTLTRIEAGVNSNGNKKKEDEEIEICQSKQ